VQRHQGGEQLSAARRQTVTALAVLLDDIRFLKIAQPLAEHARRHSLAARLQGAKTQTLSPQLP